MSNERYRLRPSQESIGVKSMSVELFTGRVAWFDMRLGYGFMDVDGIDEEVLLHASVLRVSGVNSILPGCALTCEIEKTARGFRATRIDSIERDKTEAPASPTIANARPTSDDKLRPARVKWYCFDRGYGFLNLFGDTNDTFIHEVTLNRCGLAGLECGEAVAVRVQEEEGRLAAIEIQPWPTQLP